MQQSQFHILNKGVAGEVLQASVDHKQKSVCNSPSYKKVNCLLPCLSNYLTTGSWGQC